MHKSHDIGTVEVNVMSEILVISPYHYALAQKVDDIKLRKFCAQDSNYNLHVIQALPYEVADKIKGQSFDFAYIDNHYIDEEIAEIRSHITGEQYKRIKFF